MLNKSLERCWSSMMKTDGMKGREKMEMKKDEMKKDDMKK